MKLEKQITLRPSKYTDPNNQIINPDPITLDELNIMYIDHEAQKQYYVSIQHVPQHIMLYQAEEYEQNPDITKAQANDKLLELAKDDLQSFLQNQFPRTLEDDPYGPGTILASMFSAIGIKSTPTCSCRRHALEMNKNGIEWCEENVSTICGWLKEECEKRKIPYVDTVARMVVNIAINKAKKYKETGNA